MAPRPMEKTMYALFRDLKLAVRALRRTPLYSTAAIVTLALGIGATTAIYSVVDATMLQPLPYASPERLMEVTLTVAERPGEPASPMVWSYPKFETMRRLQRSFSQVAGYATSDVTLTGGGEAERVRAELVSGTYFPLLGGRAALGRALQPSDDAATSAPVAVISHGLWMRRFGGDPLTVGREVTLSGHRLLVVGVAAPEFRALSGSVDLWVPMARAAELLYPDALTEPWAHWMDAVGRLRDGVGVEGAAAELRALGPRIDEAHAGPERGSRWGAQATTLREARSDPQLRRAILILFGAVSCVLLIACVNVANLLLARAAGREREFAIRAAIGAKRGQLVRQLLSETLLLAVGGGVLGVTIAAWSLDALRRLEPGTTGVASTQGSQFLDLASVALHPGVLAFALFVSLATGVLCGVVPALRASSPDLAGSLKDGAGATSEGALSFRRGRARAILIAGDVAISLLLLVGAGLLARSFAAARGVDAGFESRNVLTFRLQPPDDPAFQGEGGVQYKRELLERLAAIPGVEASAINYCTPLSQGCNATLVLGVDGARSFARGAEPRIGVHAVNEDYLRTIGARLVRGRFITDADRIGAPKVVVLSEAAARHLFPGVDPIGRTVSLAIGLFADGEFGQVVGVAADVNYGAVGDAPAPQAYVSTWQATSPRGMLFLRTTGAPAAMIPEVRAALRAFNADLPMYDVLTLEERVGQALGRLRFGAVLLGAFAALGLLLSVVGIYGVLAYSVAQRSRELGIRLALGAARREVMALVMRRAMALAALGVVAGLAAAWGASRFLHGLVFGIAPTDPATFGAIAVLVTITCAAASYLPARRASRLDPMQALRDS